MDAENRLKLNKCEFEAFKIVSKASVHAIIAPFYINAAREFWAITNYPKYTRKKYSITCRIKKWVKRGLDKKLLERLRDEIEY